MSELDLKGALNPYEQLPGATKPSVETPNHDHETPDQAPQTLDVTSGSITSVRSIVFSKLQEMEPNF